MIEFPKDRKILTRALRERWPIKPEQRVKVLDVVERALESPDIKDALHAARTMATLDALNIKEQEVKIKAQPKVVIHAQMSTEDLEKRFLDLQNELGFTSLSEQDQLSLIDAEQAYKQLEEEKNNEIPKETTSD